MICMDTDGLVSILRYQNGSEKLAERLDNENASTTVINLYEIIAGARISSDKEKNLQEAKKLLSKLTILHMDEESSEKAAEIYADLYGKGNIIDVRDIFIASIALSHGCELITRNEKDFSRIKGLKTVKW